MFTRSIRSDPPVIPTRDNIKQLIEDEKRKLENNRRRVNQMVIKQEQNQRQINIIARETQSLWNDILQIEQSRIISPHLVELKAQVTTVLRELINNGRIVDVRRLISMDDNEIEIFMREFNLINFGAGLDFIKSLPTFIYEKKEGEEVDNCSICLHSLLDNPECIKLNCNHFFHKGCIFNWLRVKKNCPLCKAVVQNPVRERA